MEPQARPDSDPAEIPPYLLSREYEDHLDWLENQRRTRGGDGHDRPRFFRLFSLAAGVGTLLSVMMRHVRTPRG